MSIASIRILPPAPTPARKGASKCGVCNRATARRKPFCKDHILRLPYPASVRRDLDSAQADQHRVNTGGVLAADILTVVRHQGPCTVGRLRRLLHLPHTVAAKYVRALVLEGTLRTRRVRGEHSTMVSMA